MLYIYTLSFIVKTEKSIYINRKIYTEKNCTKNLYIE